MKEFFNLNLNKGTSLEVVWDASKAYMRGVLIQLNNEYRRKREKRRRELEEEIKEKELILIRNPLDKGIQESTRLLREQFNMLMGDQVATNLQYAKHNTFCNANKPGRLLAYQLRKKQKSRIIERIVYKGKQVFQQDLIKKAFLEFYKNLYASGKISSEGIDRYLQKGNIGKITQEQREGLNRAITSEEILLVIKQLKERKAPGTDGLTATYYKYLQGEMVEPLKELFVSIQLGGEVPPSWRTAFISLIPKEDQDLTQTKNYRPISLLNVDYKIFAKVLANRLMIVMQGLIHKDQTGFIEGRQMKSNVRQIINMLEYLEKNRQVSAALIFIDAEKAFDRLDWQFLFKVIEKMEFGDYFMQSIMMLYQSQTAQIVINGTLTESFVIERGTRQGCPLSPLLFILTLEILLNKVRETEVIKGVKVGQLEYKVRAFADDIVVMLSRPLQSVEGLKDILFQYGQVSGFKVNEGKTKLLIKNMSVRSVEELERRTGFEVVKKVKYLGVYITTSNKKLFVCNYEALWQKIRMDLEKWKKLQLSLLGRIAIIKMNILPKFLFLFQMIPILKKEEELKIWQRGINSFIWAGKKARIKQKIMQDVKERGGLKVPNLSLYYEAAVLSVISDWVNLTQADILNLEGVGLGYGWHAYLLYGKKDDKIFKGHVLRDALLRVWNKYLHTLNGKLPIWTIPGQVIDFIRVGDRQGMISYGELLWMERGVLQLKSLNQLREDWKTLTWFQYAQLQTRWKQDQKKGIILEEGILMKQIRDQGKMHIKRLYNVLVEMDSETELVKDCMIKWAQNFGEPVMLETWEKIWVTNVKFTQAQNLRENFYKMFYRWHLDPKKLSCMYPNVKPNCWRCECEDATYYHIWWTCKKVKAFWIKIWWIMQNIFKKKIKFSPQFFLLGIITDCTVRETKLMLNLITAARLLVAQYWKKEDMPTIEEWTLKVMNLAEMAKISAYLKDHSNERFVEEWRRWIEYIQRKYQMKNMKITFE